MKQIIGKIIFKIIKAGGAFLFKCLLAFLIQKSIKRGNDKMANTNNSIWTALGQIALAAAASYGAAKLSNKETSWTPYREQLIQNVASVALSTAIQQYNVAATANTAAANTETTGHQ